MKIIQSGSDAIKRKGERYGQTRARSVEPMAPIPKANTPMYFFTGESLSDDRVRRVRTGVAGCLARR